MCPCCGPGHCYRHRNSDTARGYGYGDRNCNHTTTRHHITNFATRDNNTTYGDERNP